jgi:hypothetical protein
VERQEPPGCHKDTQGKRQEQKNQDEAWRGFPCMKQKLNEMTS